MWAKTVFVPVVAAMCTKSRMAVPPGWALLFYLQIAACALGTAVKDEGINCESPASGDIQEVAAGDVGNTKGLSLNCSDERNLVAVQIKHQASKHLGRVSVWACPKVKQLSMQLSSTDGQVQWMDLPSSAGVVQCRRADDTMVVVKGYLRAHFSSRFTALPAPSQEYRLNYSYSIHEETVREQLSMNSSDSDNKTVDGERITGTRWRRFADDKISSQAHSINKTVAKEGNVVKTHVSSTAECGTTKTCIRFGRRGCGHLQCEYMLSYRLINKTEVDIELSALSKGWVAVGFSSDKYMGGGDDVIGCKRHQLLSSQVVSMSLYNSVPYVRPKEKENRLTLMDGRLQDGFIYCNLRRPLRSQMRPDDSDLDLTNDWHQLYAVGDINGNGAILQHSKTPWVSSDKITMLRHMDVTETVSCASVFVITTVPFLLSLTLSFAV